MRLLILPARGSITDSLADPVFSMLKQYPKVRKSNSVAEKAEGSPMMSQTMTVAFLLVFTWNTLLATAVDTVKIKAPPALGVAGRLFEFTNDRDSGVMVTKVEPNTSAQRMRKDGDAENFYVLVPDKDVIYKIDDVRIKNFLDLREELKKKRGTEIKLTVRTIDDAGRIVIDDAGNIVEGQYTVKLHGEPVPPEEEDEVQ